MSGLPTIYVGFLLVSALTLVPGCNQSPLSSDKQLASPSPSLSAAPQVPESGDAQPSTPAATSVAAPSNLISSQGIGDARLGMTFADLKQALGENARFEVKSPFMVDFDAIAVIQADQIQYYILYLAGEAFSDQDRIQGLFTDNPAYRTETGVGTGTSIQQAIAAYGTATLSYNTANESREYVRFERQPAPNISFATGNGNLETAGIYPSTSGEYNETQEFKETGTIESVLVICLSETCAEP